MYGKCSIINGDLWFCPLERPFIYFLPIFFHKTEPKSLQKPNFWKKDHRCNSIWPPFVCKSEILLKNTIFEQYFGPLGAQDLQFVPISFHKATEFFMKNPNFWKKTSTPQLSRRPWVPEWRNLSKNGIFDVYFGP